MTNDFMYTRLQVIKALEKRGVPSTDQQIFVVWKEISNLDKIKQIEEADFYFGQTDRPANILGIAKDDDDGLLIIFRAAIVDLINSKQMAHNKDGLLCLIEWIPDPKKRRSVDDEWDS